MSALCEVLESRTLLSAAPHGKANSAAVQADLALIANDRQIIIRDNVTCRTAVAAMRASIPAARAESLQKLHEDQLKLREDRGNTVLVDQDRAQILLDKSTLKDNLASIGQQIKNEQAMCKETLASDRAQLKLHQAQLAFDRRA